MSLFSYPAYIPPSETLVSPESKGVKHKKLRDLKLKQIEYLASKARNKANPGNGGKTSDALQDYGESLVKPAFKPTSCKRMMKHEGLIINRSSDEKAAILLAQQEEWDRREFLRVSAQSSPSSLVMHVSSPTLISIHCNRVKQLYPTIIETWEDATFKVVVNPPEDEDFRMSFNKPMNQINFMFLRESIDSESALEGYMEVLAQKERTFYDLNWKKCLGDEITGKYSRWGVAVVDEGEEWILFEFDAVGYPGTKI